MRHLSELLMPEDVRPVTSHLFFEKQPHGRSVLPRESTGVFHLPVTPTELALVGPALLELTYPLALELVLHSAIVTDFTMERLLTPFSWERERRAKIINELFVRSPVYVAPKGLTFGANCGSGGARIARQQGWYR